MKNKNRFLVRIILLFFIIPFIGVQSSWSQTLLGSAAGDFYSAFAKMGINEKKLNTLDDLTPFIPDEVFRRLDENLVYRIAFISFAANQHGVISGITSSVGFAETLNALTGFLMVIEENDDLEEWTIKEISSRYEQLLASSWRNINSPLFTVILDAYCSFKRGELWK